MMVPRPCYLLILVCPLTLAWVNNRPIIGILAQEISEEVTLGHDISYKLYQNYSCFIAASYVKAMEQSGARVVPIFINKTEDYYRDLLSVINGVVFPGGGARFTDKGGYADAGRIILNYAKEANSRGDNFPIYATCLGMELLFYLEVESYGILDSCNSVDVPLPLIFKNQFRRSKLYYRLPYQMEHMLSTLPITYNHHKKCVTEDLLAEYNLTKKWHVLSTSIDLDGKRFISSVEVFQQPIVGIQFHPEKNAFEWNAACHFPHSYKAVNSARYFFDWVIEEARKSNHSFKNKEEESDALIYNYNPPYLGSDGYYEQIYLFN